MKKYLINIILFSFVIFVVSSLADEKETMQYANELYKNNKYQQAVEQYTKLVDEGYEGTSLFYNLGNAHYRLGQIGYAILYYEKALRLSPDDEDAKHNLELAKINVKDKIDTLPPFFIFTLWEELLAFFSVNGWTIVVYIIFILLLLAVVLYFFARSVSRQRFAFFSGVVIAVLFLLSVILLTVKINKEYNQKEGVIVASAVVVKSSPDSTSKDEFQIHEGLKIKLEDQVDNWVKIRLADGKIGWIMEKNIGII